MKQDIESMNFEFTMDDYIAYEKNRITQSITDQIHNEYKIMRKRNKKLPTLKKYKASEAFKEELEKRLNENKKYQKLLNDDIVNDSDFISGYEKRYEIMKNQALKEQKDIVASEKDNQLKYIAYHIDYAYQTFLENDDTVTLLKDVLYDVKYDCRRKIISYFRSSKTIELRYETPGKRLKDRYHEIELNDNTYYTFMTYINHNGWNYDFLIDKAYDYDIISVIIDALANKSKKFSKFKEYAEKGENSHFDSSRFNSVFTDYLYEVYVDMNDDMIIHFDASEVINHIKKNSNYAEMFKLLS